jgi:hypothetical protein
VSHCMLSSMSASVTRGLPLMHRWFLLSLIVLLSACGADTRGKKPVVPAELPDVPTLMTQRGKVLLNEPFTTPAWTKTMGSYKADLELSDGHLRVTPEAGAGHAPQINLFAPMTNLVIQVRFRLDGAKWANVQVSDPKRKENLAAVGVDAQRVSMSRITGWGKTTKFTSLGTTPITGDPAAWHTLVVEWCGNECLAHLDGRVVLHGESEQFGMAKGQLSFNSSGGSVWYDDVRVWEGVPDPAWATRKAEVIKPLPH